MSHLKYTVAALIALLTGSALAGGRAAEGTFSEITGTVTQIDAAARRLEVRDDDGKSYQLYASANVPIYNAINSLQDFQELGLQDRVHIGFEPGTMKASEITDLKPSGLHDTTNQ